MIYNPMLINKLKVIGINMIFFYCPRCEFPKEARTLRLPDNYRYCQYHQEEILREVKIK